MARSSHGRRETERGNAKQNTDTNACTPGTRTYMCTRTRAHTHTHSLSLSLSAISLLRLTIRPAPESPSPESERNPRSVVPSPAVAGLPVGAAGFAAGSAWPSRRGMCTLQPLAAHFREPNHARKLLRSECFGGSGLDLPTHQLAWKASRIPKTIPAFESRVRGLGFCLGLRLRFRLRFRLRRSLSLATGVKFDAAAAFLVLRGRLLRAMATDNSLSQQS